MPLEALYIVGIVMLAAAFAYGYMRSRNRNRANDPIREAATKQLYDNPEGYEKGGKERLEREVKPER
jgi:hypothetical protein